MKQSANSSSGSEFVALDDAQLKSIHWRWTLIAALGDYLDAGSIVAGGASLAMWVALYHHTSPDSSGSRDSIINRKQNRRRLWRLSYMYTKHPKKKNRATKVPPPASVGRWPCSILLSPATSHRDEPQIPRKRSIIGKRCRSSYDDD